MQAIINIKPGNLYSFLNGRTVYINIKESDIPESISISFDILENCEFTKGQFTIVNIDAEMEAAKRQAIKTGRKPDKDFYNSLKRYCKINNIQLT